MVLFEKRFAIAIVLLFLHLFLLHFPQLLPFKPLDYANISNQVHLRSDVYYFQLIERNGIRIGLTYNDHDTTQNC